MWGRFGAGGFPYYTREARMRNHAGTTRFVHGRQPHGHFRPSTDVMCCVPALYRWNAQGSTRRSRLSCGECLRTAVLSHAHDVTPQDYDVLPASCPKRAHRDRLGSICAGESQDKEKCIVLIDPVGCGRDLSCLPGAVAMDAQRAERSRDGRLTHSQSPVVGGAAASASGLPLPVQRSPHGRTHAPAHLGFYPQTQ